MYSYAKRLYPPLQCPGYRSTDQYAYPFMPQKSVPLVPLNGIKFNITPVGPIGIPRLFDHKKPFGGIHQRRQPVFPDRQCNAMML